MSLDTHEIVDTGPEVVTSAEQQALGTLGADDVIRVGDQILGAEAMKLTDRETAKKLLDYIVGENERGISAVIQGYVKNYADAIPPYIDVSDISSTGPLVAHILGHLVGKEQIQIGTQTYTPVSVSYIMLAIQHEHARSESDTSKAVHAVNQKEQKLGRPSIERGEVVGLDETIVYSPQQIAEEYGGEYVYRGQITQSGTLELPSSPEIDHLEKFVIDMTGSMSEQSINQLVAQINALHIAGICTDETRYSLIYDYPTMDGDTYMSSELVAQKNKNTRLLTYEELMERANDILMSKKGKGVGSTPLCEHMGRMIAQAKAGEHVVVCTDGGSDPLAHGSTGEGEMMSAEQYQLIAKVAKNKGVKVTVVRYGENTLYDKTNQTMKDAFAPLKEEGMFSYIHAAGQENDIQQAFDKLKDQQKTHTVTVAVPSGAGEGSAYAKVTFEEYQGGDGGADEGDDDSAVLYPLPIPISPSLPQIDGTVKVNADGTIDLEHVGAGKTTVEFVYPAEAILSVEVDKAQLERRSQGVAVMMPLLDFSGSLADYRIAVLNYVLAISRLSEGNALSGVALGGNVNEKGYLDFEMSVDDTGVISTLGQIEKGGHTPIFLTLNNTFGKLLGFSLDDNGQMDWDTKYVKKKTKIRVRNSKESIKRKQGVQALKVLVSFGLMPFTGGLSGLVLGESLLSLTKKRRKKVGVKEKKTQQNMESKKKRDVMGRIVSTSMMDDMFLFLEGVVHIDLIDYQPISMKELKTLEKNKLKKYIPRRLYKDEENPAKAFVETLKKNEYPYEYIYPQRPLGITTKEQLEKIQNTELLRSKYPDDDELVEYGFEYVLPTEIMNSFDTAIENLEQKNPALHKQLLQYRGMHIPLCSDGLSNEMLNTGVTNFSELNFNLMSPFIAKLFRKYDIKFDFVKVGGKGSTQTARDMIANKQQPFVAFAQATGGKTYEVDVKKNGVGGLFKHLDAIQLGHESKVSPTTVGNPTHVRVSTQDETGKTVSKLLALAYPPKEE